VSREDHTPVPGLAHVSAVFVHPDRWRRGIAALMLDAAVAAMREQGYDRAQLWTLAGSPAERLYAAAGEPKALWQVPEAGHVQAFAARPDEWVERVGSFLDEHQAGAAPEAMPSVTFEREEAAG
jgi:hypothetical protein